MHRGCKSPCQRSHSFITCATLDLQIGSPRPHGNPRKWELLATAPVKGGSGKVETTSEVPEVTAKAEVPTTSRTHILHHATHCSLRCQGQWFSGLAEPQNSRNSLKTTDGLILVLCSSVKNTPILWSSLAAKLKHNSFSWIPTTIFNGWPHFLSHRIGGDKSKTHMRWNLILSITDTSLATLRGRKGILETVQELLDHPPDC